MQIYVSFGVDLQRAEGDGQGLGLESFPVAIFLGKVHDQ